MTAAEQAVDNGYDREIATVIEAQTVSNLIIPRRFTRAIGLKHEDHVRVTQEGKRLIVERAD
jgi:hypothetical protein